MASPVIKFWSLKEDELKHSNLLDRFNENLKGKINFNKIPQRPRLVKVPEKNTMQPLKYGLYIVASIHCLGQVLSTKMRDKSRAS